MPGDWQAELDQLRQQLAERKRRLREQIDNSQDILERANQRIISAYHRLRRPRPNDPDDPPSSGSSPHS